eukprot:CAMPEP_0197047704 /NCGR_PEP_ID=MMETSP1384-20130603/23168_1 /TAXON_ID=29189 /ORGANISM="Ammonia sp." /LENGTH=242 /DNA_ID=CAMNT_0042479687 /DNA_START=8 /DNA_END=732 /DNA_ORIENTATION=+
MTYYFDQVQYSPAITDNLPYSQCHSHSYNDSSNCDTLSTLSSMILGINISTVLVITTLCLVLCKLILSKKKPITKLRLFLCFIVICLCWALLTVVIWYFMKYFPFKVYCAYSGDDTGCKWYSATYLLLAATSLLSVLASVVLALFAPFCKVFRFLPFFGTNDDDDETTSAVQQRFSSMDDDGTNINMDDVDEHKHDSEMEKRVGLLAFENRGNREHRRRKCAFLTIPECCSMVVLSIGLVFV